MENYTPELLPKLFSVHSPLMCGAVYCRKVLGMKEKLAFISPCIAKKMEIDDLNNAGLVSSCI
ncbi:[Fe-Fe] hydrogenase large subunit C-terminal domain-containing protein [Butyrivibrio sp. INlla16]|uniref:[Fe-Fe] hydrogenase large subunit C-terminal domain-containing protein n=1 Tax=Butyrivibrio sp. INlla16 TaxID=1520807 RepID=UPI000B815FC4|nr:[Fe-Fe] hydrogenase large subunit C-terminal domain-containing protein [Butyrivibrio sp. INlla16]